MPSFDIASKVPWPEVDNALQQAKKEIAQRYDFKDTGTEVEKNQDGLVVTSNSEDRALAALGVLQEKLIKRKVGLKFFDVQDPKPTSKGGSSILAKAKEGIEGDPARKIVAAIKDAKLKVQASVQGDELRVTGKKRDDLQAAIAHIRGLKVEQPLQYVNFRE